MSKNLSLGDRMKLYEEVTRGKLPPRTYTLMRVDGRAFHTFTKKFKRPFDDDFVNMMNQSAVALCSEVQGAKIGFVQSDEISVVMTDFDDINTTSWFDGVVQKICSNSASIVTETFNREYIKWLIKNNCINFDINQIIDFVDKNNGARFDSRVFTIPSPTDVINYLIWRQQDATRNSISAAALALYSHSQLNGKSGSEKQEMMFQKGVNWNDYPDGLKRGRVIMRNEDGKWVVVDPPIFTQNWDWLTNIIPNYK